ncbi:MAG: class I SAM-dependent methyltransferase [Cumulibacter sp.]
MLPVRDSLRVRSPLPSARVALAKRLIPFALDRVPARIRSASGPPLQRVEPEPDAPQIDVIRPERLTRRMAHHPKIGIGEGYMVGDWREAPGTDLADALVPFAASIDTILPKWLTRLRRLIDRPMPRSMRNSIEQSRHNIEAHYDLSNELFALFLDESMTYSSALFLPQQPRTADTLQEAQQRKIDAALDRARVTEGTSLLEIGTGWGALAIRAAQRGAKVTSITLSREQAALAEDRAQRLGVGEQIEIRLQDYRDIEGQYDAIVSIEMIEAVGAEYWATYFATIDARLAFGGTAVVQAILMNDEHMRRTRSSYGWIQKHIFPGGLIPSLPAIERTLDDATTLRMTEMSAFGPSYADTLRIWRDVFDARVDEVRALGWSEEMIRAWRFYLAYSEAGFRTGYLDVAQLRFERPAEAARRADGG